MSALPNAVRKQIERANQIVEQVNRAQQQQPAETAAPSPPQPAETAAPSLPQPAETAAPSPPQPAETAAPSPPQPAETAAPLLPATPSSTDWEHRYRVLQGKYNAEVPRLQEQARESDRRMRLLEDQLAATQKLLSSLGTPAQGAASPVQPAAPAKLVKDEEIAEFGSDLYDFVKRTAREAVVPDIESRFQQTLKPVAAKVREVEAQVTEATRKTAQSERENVHALLTRDVPNWLELNEDVGFNDWLDQVDPFSGAKRRALLWQAYERNDGPRVVAFFQGYLKEHAAVTPSPSTSPAAGSAAPQVSLERMVAPGAPKQGTASTQEGAGKRIWSRAEISKFYGDLRAGKYAKRPEDAKKIEADIFKATTEGRVR